ncbi:restriction endonuclease [Paenibacillus sp. MER TA 81-3]|uniref:restriction endonuclease n=1 Tax=Paenibacillus sp. MER TA 81-3 TaxID=2939573 RepID=UPI00203A99A4|nr:restriction endonuclease [Paenibacillus sp. MER TA 81-3]MCM3339581.1 restriction endonuclease [Paenibacillus sp. MER TA 81-3]
MARKSKSKQEEEFLKAMFGLVGIGSFVGTYYYTKSINISTVVGIIAIGMLVAILIVRHVNKTERLKKSGIAEIDQMDGRQFEHYLGLLFKSQGYSVKVTRAAGDYGADLVIARDGRKIVVQAKRYSKNVGIDAVQQIHSSMNYYGASEAWVLSNRNYTEAAVNLAKANGVRLINRKELVAMILKMNPGAVPEPKQILQEIPQATRTCDRCGHPMVTRKGPKGEFFGCSTFPKCRNIKPFQ